MTWSAPEGVAAVLLHSRAAGPVDVALVLLAPGAVDPMTTHAFTERIRVLGGTISVTTRHGQVELTPMDSVLVIEPGLEHEIAWREGEVSYLSIMSGRGRGDES